MGTKRPVSRRTFIKAAGVATGGAAAVWLATGGREALRRLTEERLTSEQRKAAEYFNKASQEDFVYNLTALGQDGQPVNLRTRPATPTDYTEWDFRAGEVVSKLNPEDRIEKAIVVWGGNPSSVDQRKPKRWYAFLDPDDPKRVVFAYAGLFEPAGAQYSVKAYDLDN